jgi:hypothetical protein
MDYEMDVVCTATAGKRMRKGVAEALFMKLGPTRTDTCVGVRAILPVDRC